jgi:hypothetical protein
MSSLRYLGVLGVGGEYAVNRNLTAETLRTPR